MPQVTITLEPAVLRFYTRVAATAGLSLEQVLSDALFKLAGELSLEALRQDLILSIYIPAEICYTDSK